MHKKSKLTILLFLIGLILGCGSDSSNPDNNTNITTSKLVKYEFSATVDLISGQVPFSVVKGDTVYGTFSYDPLVKDSFIQTNIGKYRQSEPASAQLKVGSITVNSDLNTNLGYAIQITNDDSSTSPTRDELSWGVNDTALAATYNLDYVQIVFMLRDFTSTVFENDVMPTDISLNNFSNNYIFLNGIKGGGPVWFFRCSQFNSLKRIQ